MDSLFFFSPFHVLRVRRERGKKRKEEKKEFEKPMTWIVYFND